MQANVYTQYGSLDVIKFQEAAQPTPKANQLLIQVHAAALNAAEIHLISGSPFFLRFMEGGLRQPAHPIPGADIAGRVVAVGAQVTQFKVGDEVFGDLSNSGWGAFAQYVCADEKAVALKPAGLTFEQAAAVPLAGITALQGLRDKAQLKAGQQVLINGASGGVGTFAVQIAKAMGAHVTAVCSTSKVEMVRSLGADQVIDYKKTNILQIGGQYDLIFDIAAKEGFTAFNPLLKPQGKYLVVGGDTSRIFQAMILGSLTSLFSQRQYGTVMAHPDQNDLQAIKKFLESGQVKPVIDKVYPLSQVREALQYLKAGRAQGKIVIGITH